MNFIDGYLSEASGELLFTDKDASLKLNISPHRQIIEKSISDKELCLGIRPEHVLVVSPGENDSFEVIARNIQFFGMENVVEFRLKGESETRHSMTVPPEITPKIDDKIWVRLQIDKIHLIDPATEKVLA
jgi:ABC-type sugar transport system ATPase subunit